MFVISKDFPATVWSYRNDSIMDIIVRYRFASPHLDERHFVIDYGELSPYRRSLTSLFGDTRTGEKSTYWMQRLGSSNPQEWGEKLMGKFAHSTWPHCKIDVEVYWPHAPKFSPDLFIFAASHQLHGLGENHKCSRLHGHNYRVLVYDFEGGCATVGKPLWQDYRQSFADHIDEVYDHRHLNDVMVEQQTSAEVIAKVLYNYLKSKVCNLKGVAVSETTKTWALYTEGERYSEWFTTDSTNVYG